MRYLLDTDVFSVIARQNNDAAHKKLAQMESGSVMLSLITRAEVAFGLEKQPVGPALLGRILSMQRLLPTLPLNDSFTAHYARTRDHLEKRGTPIGHNDLWLAAHALSADVTVVTGNTREFKRVPGLRVENWLV